MELRSYVDEDGIDRFQQDLMDLPERASRRVRVALERMEDGNLGDHKSLSDGLWEHRIHSEGGIRTYFAKLGDELVLLLTTGLKSDQTRDIRIARERLKDHEERSSGA